MLLHVFLSEQYIAYNFICLHYILESGGLTLIYMTQLHPYCNFIKPAPQNSTM